MPRRAKPPIASLATYGGAYVTPRQLGDYFGFHPMTVIRWCQTGRIAALKVGHDWRITIESARETEAALFRPRKTA